jgi:hypothetical protein
MAVTLQSMLKNECIDTFNCVIIFVSLAIRKMHNAGAAILIERRSHCSVSIPV